MIKQITAEEVANRVKNGEGIHVIDVREDGEVAKGMIPGAKHIPFGQLAIRKDELDKGMTYVVVCQSGNRSKAVCGILDVFGFTAWDMIGGMNEWKGELE